jgi:hypothetical protein
MKEHIKTLLLVALVWVIILSFLLIFAGPMTKAASSILEEFNQPNWKQNECHPQLMPDGDCMRLLCEGDCYPRDFCNELFCPNGKD